MNASKCKLYFQPYSVYETIVFIVCVYMVSMYVYGMGVGCTNAMLDMWRSEGNISGHRLSSFALFEVGSLLFLLHCMIQASPLTSFWSLWLVSDGQSVGITDTHFILLMLTTSIVRLVYSASTW